MSRLGRESRRAAIHLMHVGAEVASPHDALEVDAVSRGIRRAGKQPPRKKAPAIDAQVQRLADAAEPQTRQWVHPLDGPSRGHQLTAGQRTGILFAALRGVAAY